MHRYNLHVPKIINLPPSLSPFFEGFNS
jgi:folate-dependent phosphoribosylglycinamide formyltransferase PurN